jgi:hypothetical protein
MALPTGSGSETLQSHLFRQVNGNQPLIYGVQHHVYTVKTVIVHCIALSATVNNGFLLCKGHDGHDGASGSQMFLSKFNLQVGQTFVWSDVFSFNGVEPSGTNAFSASEQIAIAGQTGSAVQEFQFGVDSASDTYDILITYIDQDWS